MELGTQELAHPSAYRQLSGCYKSRRGSGLRLALALALAAQNDLEPMKTTVVPYLIEAERLARLLDAGQRANPQVDPREVEAAVVRLLIAPAVKLVVWDVATEGRGPLALWANWTRE